MKNVWSIVLIALALSGCERKEPTEATVPAVAAPAAAPIINPLLKWTVKTAAGDYDAPALAQQDYTLEMQPADLGAAQVSLAFKDKAGSDTFKELRGITLQRVDGSSSIRPDIPSHWKTSTDFISIAAEIINDSFTYYEATGRLIDAKATPHPVLVFMVPAGDYNDKQATNRYFAIVIVNLDEHVQETVPPQPGTLDATQGGVIHGPG